MADSLLLVLPLPAYRAGSVIYLDSQACYGLDLWLKYFKDVVLACPTLEVDQVPAETKPVHSISSAARLTFQALPYAYRPVEFVSLLPSTVRLISKLMDRCRYLQFAIGGFWGDWGAVSSILADRKRRPFAVWTDRVESRVMAFQSSAMRGPKRVYYGANAKLASLLERAVIKRADVGLFNGMDCYKAYAPFCKNPQLVANYNFAEGTHISDAELDRRLADLGERAVRFIYVGRVHKDKGVFDWIDALSRIDEPFSATWFGDGPELEKARGIISGRGLNEKIRFPGNAAHDEVLQELKQHDVLVFCHKTPESPRCLIEALACGLPIVGYESEYARQLISVHSGGQLSQIHDVPALANSLRNLILGRNHLAALTNAAARDGKRFNAEATFRHRSELIRLLSATR